LEETEHFIVFGLLVAPLSPSDVARGIGQHHDKRLVIHTVQNILSAPAGGICNLPDQTEGAMATFIFGL